MLNDLDFEKIHRDANIVDLHAHPSLKISLFKRALTSPLKVSRSFDPFSFRSDFSKLKAGSVDVLLSSIVAPEKGILEECKYLKILQFLMPFTWNSVFNQPYFKVTMEMLNRMERAVEKSKLDQDGNPLIKMVFSVQELDEILNQSDAPPIAVIHSVEGAHSLDGNLDNLQKLFDRGVAYLTLAHFYANDAVHPVFPYPESVQMPKCFQGGRNLALGLTKFGEQVIEKMVELGMILDITHCTPPARKRIYDIVGKDLPIIASHIGAFEINPSPYNLKDWEIKRIADIGGVVAVIFMNYWLMAHETKRGLNFIARTIEHFVNVGGIDHVAIGSDFDGFTDPPDDLKDASELPKLTQRLLAEGYNREEIERILGANALRVIREGWGKK
jgi:microsomal dipeptidase-like Zn-dependent dipeptidase